MIDVGHFAGQEAGETIHLFLRRHWLSLAWSLRWVAAGVAACLVALILAGGAPGPWQSLVPVVTIATVAAGALLGLAALWTYSVWYYDVYLVTDRRLLDFARKPLIYERRHEAQLSRVQDVRVNYPNPVALVLDFGDVKVQTAGSKGAITCRAVPHPRLVQAKVLQLVAGAQKRAAAAPSIEAEQMRQFMGMESPPGTGAVEAAAVAPLPPAGTGAGPQTAPTEVLQAPPVTWRAYVTSLFRPALDVGANDLVWRKHWWVLMRGTAVAGGLFNGGLVLAAVMLWQGGITPWLAIPLTMVLVGGLWNLWNVIDWQNDLYILTDDRIIDIEKVPLISEDRREARLQQVQDVHYVMPGFINRFLDFGDVEVETAGRSGGFTFKSVPHPREVQAEIFARLERVRKAVSVADRQRQEAEMLAMLYKYRQADQKVGADDQPDAV